MNIDATEIMVIAELSDKSQDVVEITNDPFNHYLSNQEVRLWMFDNFGCCDGVEFNPMVKS